MRLTIDLTPTDDNRIEGRLAVEGAVGSQSFSGWLELLAILEVLRPRVTSGRRAFD